ncbi:MAG: hypothetical protein NTAFB09_21130 [Nitrosospira sp.]
MIDSDAIRKEIAVRYGFVLDKDDPALVSGMIFDSVLEQAVSTLNAQQESNLKALLAALQKGNEETKRLAAKVVNEGTEYACDQLHAAIKATMQESQEEFKQEMRKAWVEIQAAKKTAIMGAAVSATCSVIMVGAMATMATHVL